MLGHVRGSVNISGILLGELYDNYLDKSKTYYIYCSYGHLSKIPLILTLPLTCPNIYK